jgi:hypothetical protein
METLPCGHVALASGSRLCRHLLGEHADDDHVQRLLGRGLACDYFCIDCDKLQTVDLVTACEGCVGRVAANEPEAVRGWASVVPRVAAVSMQRLGGFELKLPFPGGIAPYRDGWMTLGYSSVVHQHGVDGSREVCTFPPLPDETSPAAAAKTVVTLYSARDGSAVTLVRDYGRYGTVASTVTGETILNLDRGDYRVELTRFPCSFTEHRGVQVLVAGTDWNRVDAFALPTGQLLTERGPTSSNEGEPEPDHDFDYFQGALHVSPDGMKVVDDGWIWHPFGIPLLWDLSRWLGGDTWQAEDATSLMQRLYLWDTPMCWVGDEHIAIWGVGNDEDTVIPGAMLLSLAGTSSPVSFAGVPRTQFWSNGSLLFVPSDIGLTVWDPFMGERLAELVGFSPLSYNPYTDEFLVKDGHRRAQRVRLVVA